MSRNLRSMLGVISVVVFVGLLSFTVYTQVQSEPGVTEEPRGTGPHPLEGFGPEDLPKTPFSDTEIEMVDLIESVSVDCSGAAPGLSVQTKEELPRKATIRILAMGPPVTDALGSVHYQGLGTADEFTVEGGSRNKYVALSSSLLSELNGAADSVIVIVAYTDADGALFESLIVRIAATEVTCAR